MGSAADWLPAGLAAFGVSYAMMLAIPGPSFLVVSNASVAGSRRAGILTSAGVASGAALLLLLALKASALLPQSDLLGEIGRLLCTLVLLVIGYRAVRRAVLPQIGVIQAVAGPCSGHFLIGLITALTNPITFSFFSSVALTAKGKLGDGVAPTLLPAGVFFMALTWFGLIALLLSLPAFQAVYGRAARHIDAVMGAALIAIALSMSFV